MYKYLLFDLDGTLTDSAEGITKCAQVGLEAVGIHETDMSKLLLFIGPPLRDSFPRYYHLNPEQVATALAAYRKRYTAIGKFENKVYPGIIELLKDLKQAGYICAMCTAKPDAYAYPIAEKFGLAPYLQDIFSATMDGTMDDKALVVASALQGLGLKLPQDKDQVVLIGDRKQDVLAAHANGIDCLGVGWGFAQPGELEEAQVEQILPTIADLRKYFLG